MATKFEVVLSAKLDTNSAAEIKKQIDNISKGVNLKINADSGSINKVKNSLNEVSNAAQNAKKHTQGLDDIISKFTSWQIVGDVIHGVKDAMGDMVEQVFKLDSSLVEFNKVTDLTESQLQSFTEQAYKTANEVARTGTEVIDAATEFSKAGYKDQAGDLAKVALLYQNIADGEVSTADASALLVSQMKAFNVEAKDSETIIDQINEVSNNFAVSSSDLATAIPKVSATLAQAGNTMSETTALITAGSEIMVGQSSRVARGLRSITLNLQGMDDEGNQNLQLVASMEKDFNKLGITLYDTDGQMKSTFEILKNLAEVYPELDQNTKNYYSALIGGKTQVDVVNSILTNFNTALGANEAAMNSAGSAAKENAVYMESLEGKVNNLKSAWQEFATNTLNSQAIKSLIALGTQIIKLADNDFVRAIAAVIAANAAFKLFSKGAALLSTNIVANGQALLQYLLIMQGVPAAEAAATASTLGLTGAIKLLTAAMFSNPLFWVAAGGLAIYGIIKAVDKLTVSYEEQIEKVNKASDAYEKAKTSLDENTSALEEKRKKIEEINKLQQEDNSKNYDNEKKTLEAEVATLEAKQKVLENNAKFAKQEQSAEAEKALAIKEHVKYYEQAAGYYKGFRLVNDNQITKIEKVNKEIENYNKYLEQKNNLTQGAHESDEKFAKRQESLQEKLDSTRASISYTAKDLVDLRDKLDTDTESGKKYADQIDEAVNAANSFEDSLNGTTEKLSVQEEYLQGLENETNELKETQTNATDVVNSYAEGNDKLREIIENSTNTVKDAKDTYDAISQSLDELQKSYDVLTNAVDEYNSNGYLSIDTLQSLLSLSDEYLSALSFEEGQLSLNTTALDQMTDALIASKIGKIQAAAASDIWALAEGNVENMSKLAQTAVNNLGTDASNMGADFASAVPDINKFTQAILEAKAAAGDTTTVENFDAKANAIIGSYQNLYKNITSLGGGTSRSGGKSSSRPHKYVGGSSGRKSGGGSKKGSSKSSKEEYKADIDALYVYKNALDIAKDAVDKLKDALGDTDNFNEQEKYLRRLIDATNTQIAKTNDLKNAQTNQINDYINQLRSQGFAIDYNASKNELYINNMQHLADFSGDTAKNLEKLIDKIQDLNKDNRSLDDSVRELTGDVKDYYEQLEDIPEKKLKKFKELMEDFQQSRLDQIQNQIEDIQHEMENDPRLKALEEQIEALEKQNDELDKQADLEEKLLAVEEAKIKLENLRKQKTLQVYREGQGWVWEEDIDAIEDAAQELKDAQDDLNDKIKQDQIDQLQAEKDALEKSYQDRIDALEDFLDEQNYLINKANREGIQTFEDLQKALAKYGLDSAEYLGKATDWLNNYNSALANLDTTVNGILASSNVATDGLIYSSAVQDRIDQALSGIIPVVSRTGLSLTDIDYDRLGTTNNNQNIYISNIDLPNVSNIDEFIAALKELPRMATSQSTNRT